MTGKEYLQQLVVLRKRINRMIEKGSSFETAVGLKSPTMNDSPVQSSHSQDRLGDGVIAIADLEKELSDMAELFYNLQDDVHTQLSWLTGKNHADVLWEVYARQKTVYKYSLEHGMKYDSAKKLHKRALEEFSKIFTQNIVVSVDNPL